MTEDQREQRRINREFFPDDLKSKAMLWFIGLLTVSVLVAYVVSTR